MKIALIGKKVESAVTYYRATGPFAELCRVNDWQMAVFLPRDMTNDILHYFDIIFLHRPIHPSETEIIWKAKQVGVKVWVDIDDLLWKIPIANPASTMFTPNDRDELMKAMINADVITCSTPAIADAIQVEYDRQSIVIPNAWNDRGGPITPFNENATRKTCLYRGSNTHDGDLYTNRAAFRKYDTIDFAFMGALPWYFAKSYEGNLPVIRHEQWTGDILTYFDRIRHINPTFFIVPLENNAFNAAKSNIAAIEATDAGAVTIYPSYLPEFAQFPGIPYDSPAHLCGVLAEIDRLPISAFRHIHEAAAEHVRKTLRLVDVNQKRAEIVEILTKKPVTA